MDGYLKDGIGCEGCAVCSEVDCGWIFDCGDHVHAPDERHLRLARWSFFVREGRKGHGI